MSRIAQRKLMEREERRTKILAAARRIAEEEGWSGVTIRRLADEIAYSQPVLYSHFDNREGILAAVAIEGFHEIGTALEKARKRARNSPLEAVATAYLEFAAASPALYEVMFSLALSVRFDDPTTPSELHFAFSQLLALFSGEDADAAILAELFWASLHGIADLSRTSRFPLSRQKQRVKTLIRIFSKTGEAPAAPEVAKGTK